MPFAEVTWHSQVLRKQTRTCLVLPRVGRGPWPVLYLLHGLSDDASAWARWTRIENYVAELPLIVALPDGYRGFYTDNAAGPAYAQHMALELPAFLAAHYRVRTRGKARAIGGLSMGGYGALRLALGFPDLYVSAHGHSGALHAGSVDYRPAATRRNPQLADRDAAHLAEMRRVFGPYPPGSDHDLRHLARRAFAAPRRPALRLDCGTEDFLLEANRSFHADLEAIGYPHTYEEHPGGHDWAYWDLHVRSAIEWHARHLGLSCGG
jgi:putative tributyrin esterase